MKVIKCDLPKDLQEIEIHIFSDLHIGDSFCNFENISQEIQKVKDTPNAYALLNGDIMNNATKSSVSDIYSECLSPKEQLERFTKLFEPIKDKILAVCNGNHEDRTYRQDGIDLTLVACTQLGIANRYCDISAVLFLSLGDKGAHNHNSKQYYSVYMTHGSGGGRKEGGKANRLLELADIIDTDIYIVGHTHSPMVLRNSFFRTNKQSGTIQKVEKVFINTASSLEYGGYGERFGFRPSSMKTPVLILNGTHYSIKTMF